MTCCHVALFNEDNVDARDMYGEPLTGRFAYDRGGCLVLQEKQLIYECNALCGCSPLCPNRVVQKGVRCRMEVFRTRHKVGGMRGWGLRFESGLAWLGFWRTRILLIKRGMGRCV